MKLSIASSILAVISAASSAHARGTSFLRDPKTVEEKEHIQRQTMGDHFLVSRLNEDADGSTCEERMKAKEMELKNSVDLFPEEAKSLACSAVSKEFEVCQGCQGFSKVGKDVHIPGCVGMTSDGCEIFASGIVAENQAWFKDPGMPLVSDADNIGLPSEMAYYKVGLPVSANDNASEGSKVITGVAGDCVVHYSWDWCVESSEGGTMCIKLQPWDCSVAVGGGCLSTYECCAHIRKEYPGPDINGNELQCYEWALPVKLSPHTSLPPAVKTITAATGSAGNGGVTGNRLIIHLNDGKVALPAVITDEDHQVNHNEEIIVVTQQACVNKSFPDGYVHRGSFSFMYPIDDSTLRAAVVAYVEQDCANRPNCDIGQEWGWPINSWCVDQVTTFRGLFRDPSTLQSSTISRGPCISGLCAFNEDINGWTTSQVINMDGVFSPARAFNQPLDNWDTSSVTNMNGLFSGATAFNQPLNSWKVSSVRNMQTMFSGATAFNQPLNSWDTSSVTLMTNMFSGATAFNQPLDKWDTSSVTLMYGVFYRASVFNQPLDNWDTSSVANMKYMFWEASAFNQPLNKWDVSKVGDMHSAFYGASNFDQNLCGWGANHNPPDTREMFKGTSCPYDRDPTAAMEPWCHACSDRATYYVGYSTGGCKGMNELGPRNVSVVEECAAECDAEEECVSFEYEKSGTSCVLSETCDHFSKTVNKPGDAYMWYLKVTDDGDDAWAYYLAPNQRGIAYLWVLGNVEQGGWVSPPQWVKNTNYYIGYSTGGCVGQNDWKYYKSAVEECARACDDQGYYCRSFEFKKEGTTNGKNCMLSKDCRYFGSTANDPRNPYLWYQKSNGFNVYWTHEKEMEEGGNAYLWLMNN